MGRDSEGRQVFPGGRADHSRCFLREPRPSFLSKSERERALKATRSLRSGGGLGHTRVTAWESHPGRYSFPGPDDPRVQLLAWGHRREGCSRRSSEDTPEPLVCRRPQPGGGLWPGGLGPRSHSALTLACVLLGKLTQALSLSFVTCTMASATGPTLACCEDLGRAKAVSCCLNWGSDEGEVTGGRAAAAGATCGTRAWCGPLSRGRVSRGSAGVPGGCWRPSQARWVRSEPDFQGLSGTSALRLAV